MGGNREPSQEAEVDLKHIVMVVEDEVVVRTLIADYLRDSGFVVIEAANASEAVAAISSQTEIHAVFTDIQMPGEMDGIMLAEWIVEHCNGVPVLLTSGARSSSVADRIGDRHFLSKPYVFYEVEKRLRALLTSDSHS